MKISRPFAFPILTVAGVVLLLAFFAPVIVGSVFGPSEDGFADDLVIPADLVVADPQDVIPAAVGGPQDTFQHHVVDALRKPGGDDASVTATVDSLRSAHNQAPEALRRYLATSPAWRVFQENGAIFATRRWCVGPQWRFSLHGYYTHFDLDMFLRNGLPHFQSRTTIGFTGKPWARGDQNTTWIEPGATVPVKLSMDNQMHESRCVIRAGDLVLELFEQSQAKERRLTRAAVGFLEGEFKLLAANADWQNIRGMLPPDSVRRGEPSLELTNSFQPGLYDSTIWVNPGEPGMIYLRAHEVTKGTPLSVDRLKQGSNEWIGWSTDASELFFSNTHFTIYEGDWGKPYAARFEVWFVPDSGQPERKLLEKVFKIEGWQR